MAIWKRLKKYREMDLDEELEKRLGEEKLEKRDLPALLLSAFLTLWLPCLVVLLVLCGIAVLLFGGLS